MAVDPRITPIKIQINVYADRANLYAVCPFMIYGEIVQRIQVSRGVILKKWPNAECAP